MYILIMIDKKLGYSKDTEKLIDKMCLLVEREDFELEKEKAVECLMKTYDLFKLKRPYRVVWRSDIFDNFFIWSAGNTWSAPNKKIIKYIAAPNYSIRSFQFEQIISLHQTFNRFFFF